ncbi:MAG: ClbS/DfsB family four-helix bundle protein [Anaerolineales bacterium]
MGAITSSKTELLAEKKRAYEEFLAAIDVVQEAAHDPDIQPAGEDWSPKDVVAHVAYWEDYFSKSLLAWLIEGTPFPGLESYDEINAYSTVLRHSVGFSNVIQELETAYHDVLRIVEELISEESLDREVRVAYLSRTGHKPLAELLTEYIEHYSEHATQLRAML